MCTAQHVFWVLFLFGGGVKKGNFNISTNKNFLFTRWKQYEAYVQALEGKYTDLNCKFGFLNEDV